MQTQIRLSSLVLAILMSIAVVIVMVALHPPLTQTYYVQLGGLVAAAGLVVTLYNRFVTARAQHRADESHAQEDILPVVEMTETDAAEPAPPAYAATTDETLFLHTADAAAEPAEELLPETLDALLDVAYEAAECEPLRAVAAYRRALARYPEDSYMPYLIIELSTLYKRLGDYNAALALFDEALALPLIAKNAVMAQEFQRSRRALTVVSHMLTARGTPTLPFGDVPKEILAEADRRAEELSI